ncbi:MAG: chromate resistance protein ChrB [Dehalococcoidia bacterium]|nr:chromate resistance protein ChrB [Dehalococcoidia bacterium]
MGKRAWLLLTYKVPPEPARHRIALWRRLKGLGAVYLQNGACLLPNSDEHLRRLKILENDIIEMRGEAVLLEAAGLDAHQEERVVQRFNAERDEQYQEFLGRCADFHAEILRETESNHFSYAELEENDEDLKKLQAWLPKIRKLDFYAAPLATAAEQALKDCEGELDTFSRLVFEAYEENRATGERTSPA